MKKLVTLILASVMAVSVFAGCSKGEDTSEPTAAPKETGNVIEAEETAYKEMIDYLQTNYSADFFTNGNTPPSDVLAYGESQITGITAMEDFFLAAQQNEPADIVIAAITGDKDPIFTMIRYDGNEYHCVIDRTRDRRDVDYQKPENIKGISFKYMKRYDYEVPERGERSSFILLDDDEAAKDTEMTYDEFTEEYDAEEGVTWLQICSY